MKTKINILVLFVLLLSACTPVTQQTETAVEPQPTEEPIPTPTEEAAPLPEQPVSTSWRAIRDMRFGFGLAIPCWWLTNPTDTDGALYTVKNYDDAYFNAHSQKGYWEWPNGTLKLDLVVLDGADPAKSVADAYIQLADPSMTGLVSAEIRQYGSHEGTVAVIANLDNPNSPDVTVFLFRLAPDKLLMVNPIPQTIIDSPDFQALLSSIVLSQDEEIILPIITPAPALIDSSCAG